MAKPSTAALSGPRHGRPPMEDERDFVLPLLREAGTTGIYRLHFLHGSGPCNGRMVTQVGRLIHDLEKEGYIFKHDRREGYPFIFYVLVSEPLEPRKPATSTAQQSGWRGSDFHYGRVQHQTTTTSSVVGQERLFETNMAYETGRIHKGKR